ncbi:MAG: M23 family metallopeptidase [Candidatus Latescibacteria bacterium]|nr:M23 family metallopeptidase [Candidatus Latescibacterota bacterium]
MINMINVIKWMVLLVAALPANAEEGGFIWPLRLAPALSSTFGESRSRAFHAGIDLKTWGETGHPIQALADGYIWRVRTSPWGYGRALYQKLADGRTVVYAHLEDFAAPMAELVQQAQQQRGHYSVDLYFKEGEIPVLGGAVIAWSGESGAGPPHLHLELRDANNVAINPLLHGFAIADTIAPTLQRVAITPHGRNAQAEGGHDPYVLSLRWQPGRGEFVGVRPVQVLGPVSISALMYDRADAAPNKLAPYRASLHIDGEPVFAARYEQVKYGDMHQMYLDRPLAAFKGGVGRFYNLCRLPGNRLQFYEGPDDGIVNLAKGRHEAVVVVADVNGNESRARFGLMVDEPPAIAGARIVAEANGTFIEARLTDADDPLVEVELASSRDGKTWRRVDRRQSRSGPLKWQIHRNASYWRIQARDPAGATAFAICRLPETAVPTFALERRPHADFVELVMRYERVPSATPLVRVDTANVSPRQTGLREFRVAVPLGPNDPAAGTVLLRTPGAAVQKVVLDRQFVKPGAAAKLTYANGAVELGFAAASAYAPFFPQVETFEPQVPAALVAAGPAFALGPDVSFDHRVELRLRYDYRETLPPEKLGIYREISAEKWSLVSNEWVGRQMVARVRRLGRYALLADLEPPEISSLQPAEGAVVGTRPEIRGAVRDQGAGIGRETDIEFELDGRLLIAEYDPEAGRVYGHLLEDLPPGAHRLVLRVRDMSGNQAEVHSEFTVR